MKKYLVNESLFSNINSQEEAYILGYLYADGYHNTDRCSFELSLNKQDEDILKEISKIFYPIIPRPIRFYGNLCRLVIASKPISNKLNEIGFTKAKTFTLKFPDIPNHLFPHFIRGYFDGDGNIYIGKNQCEFSLISTLSFCNSVSDIIKDKFDFNSAISIKKENSINKIYRIRYMRRKQIIDILTWLYKDSTIHLSRKYQKYIDLIDLENKPKRKNQYC